MHFVHVRLTHSRRHCERDEAIHKTHRKFPGLLRFARNDGKCAALSLHTPCYRNMSISFLLFARQKKRNRRKKRKHANVPCISLTLNAQMLFELSAQILSRLTITLRARSADSLKASLRARIFGRAPWHEVPQPVSWSRTLLRRQPE